MRSRRRGVRKKWRSIVVSKVGYLWCGKLVTMKIIMWRLGRVDASRRQQRSLVVQIGHDATIFVNYQCRVGGEYICIFNLAKNSRGGNLPTFQTHLGQENSYI
jgi:hypothetical protein